MTPDKLDYLPCKTCGILENKERPHPPEWCVKQFLEWVTRRNTRRTYGETK